MKTNQLTTSETSREPSASFVGRWISYRSLSTGSFRQGRITEVLADGGIKFFNQDACDGFGMYETAHGFDAKYARIS